MNWNTLNYVVEIAKQRSFSKAAQALYVAQPSLSQSIQALERELGTPIFDRSKSPIKLTYAGELFVSWANQALLTREQTFRQISDVTEGAKTRLVVGMGFSRSAFLFPNIIAEFRRLRPNCTLILEENSTNLLLESDDLDLLIDVPHDESLMSESVVVAEERMMLAVPKSFDFIAVEHEGDYPVLRLSDYSKCPFVMLSEGQMLRNVCLSLCSQEGFVPKTALECRSLQTAYSMAEAGIGVTLVPELVVRHADIAQKLRFAVIGETPTVRKIAATYRKDRYLTDDAKVLIELMKNML